jgi:hypothetical protein
MIIAALVTIAKICNQSSYSSTNKWIKKMWCYTMEYYSGTKKNESRSFAGKWMEVEVINLSEISEKDKYHMFSLSLICGI